jgi:major membrane immunogen (membrane-anchored lipoprotein)
MTRADIRAVLIRAGIMILVSILFIVMLGQFLRDRAFRAEQSSLSEKLSFFLPADRYEEIKSDANVIHPSVQAFYLARDTAGKVLGFIIDVMVEDEDGRINSRMSITPDGEKIILLRILNEDGDISNDPAALELCEQLEGARIPVALSSQMSVEVLTQNDYPPVPGLHDGTFYAEAEDYDADSYLDFVEIKVTAGRIVSVLWDARHEDEAEPNRVKASVSGAFSLGENQPMWAQQAYDIQNKFLEVQDPEKLAIKSDGTTEIVEGVRMDVHAFYELVVRCIENSKNNIPKPTATPEPTEDPENQDNKATVPTPASTSEETDRSFQPEETGILPDNDPTEDSVRDSEEPVTEVPTPTPANTVIGNEDGVVNPGDSPVLSDNIDGLPLSEIRTQIEGMPENPTMSVLTIRSVNKAYMFLREYLEWGE